MGIFSFLADRAGYGRVKDAKALAEQLKAEGEEQKRSLILEAREENQKLRETAGERASGEATRTPKTGGALYPKGRESGA